MTVVDRDDVGRRAEDVTFAERVHLQVSRHPTETFRHQADFVPTPGEPDHLDRALP
ncbi:hypothetical protein [Parafrankia soli]|uniref:hypothetical protein n=1 Tax=Parafrankia soli TaxID=2599596 RepID=UPI0012FFCFCD|nr:hypothetical protein [Parafrankia soli]